MATKQAEAKSESRAQERVRATEMFEPASKVLSEAGAEGITLADLSDKTGIRSRVLHNILYRLENAEQVRRIQKGKGQEGPVHQHRGQGQAGPSVP